MIRIGVVGVLMSMAACTQVPLSPEQAAQVCEKKARAAQGPTGSVSVGANSSGETFAGLSIGVTGDFLAGRDPMEVYTQCVIERSGQQPYRPPVLR